MSIATPNAPLSLSVAAALQRDAVFAYFERGEERPLAILARPSASRADGAAIRPRYLETTGRYYAATYRWTIRPVGFPGQMAGSILDSASSKTVTDFPAADLCMELLVTEPDSFAMVHPGVLPPLDRYLQNPASTAYLLEELRRGATAQAKLVVRGATNITTWSKGRHEIVGALERCYRLEAAAELLERSALTFESGRFLDHSSLDRTARLGETVARYRELAGEAPTAAVAREARHLAVLPTYEPAHQAYLPGLDADVAVALLALRGEIHSDLQRRIRLPDCACDNTGEPLDWPQPKFNTPTGYIPPTAEVPEEDFLL